MERKSGNENKTDAIWKGCPWHSKFKSERHSAADSKSPSAADFMDKDVKIVDQQLPTGSFGR